MKFSTKKNLWRSLFDPDNVICLSMYSFSNKKCEPSITGHSLCEAVGIHRVLGLIEISN